MKKINIILSLSLIACAVLLLGSCGGDKHNYYEQERVDATCVESGYVITVCDCGCNYHDWQELPARGSHAFTNGEPTCTMDATCGICGYTEPAEGHIGGFATCEDGPVCERCGESYGEPDGHLFENYVYDENGGNGSAGTETASCERLCGATDTRDVTTHTQSFSYYETVKNATCTEDKVIKLKCDFCTETVIETKYGTAYDHYIIEVAAREPDCGLVGWDDYEYCYNCDYSTYNEIPAQTHDYQNDVCSKCKRAVPSDGLVYVISNDGKSAYLSDLGTSSNDEHIVIAHEYEGLPVVKIDLPFLNSSRDFYHTSLTIPKYVTDITQGSIRWFEMLEQLYVEDLENLFGWEYSIQARALYLDGELVEHLKVPDSVTAIYSNQFAYNNTLKSVDLNKVELVCSDAFWYCTNLAEIDFGDSLKEIRAGAFACCGFNEIVLPETVTDIDGGCFSECTAMTSFEFSTAMDTIPESVFSGCTALKRVVIPDNIKHISAQAFLDCSSLTEIELPATLETLGRRCFSGCVSLLSISIPSSTVIDDGDYMFAGCTELSTVTLPSNVTSIYEEMFYGCRNLKTINLTNLSIKVIESNAFYGCASLNSITIPSTVTAIEDGAFSGCSALQSVTIPDNVTSMGNSAFKNCVVLSSVSIGAKVKSLGGECFANCIGLGQIAIPYNVETIGANCFNGCLNLIRVSMHTTWSVNHTLVYATEVTDNAKKLTETHVGYKWTRQ